MVDRSAGGESTGDYFWRAHWVGGGRAAIFASNLGSEHLVGLAGSGPRAACHGHYELTLCLLVLGCDGAFSLRSGGSMPEFLERRYTAGGPLDASGCA